MMVGTLLYQLSLSFVATPPDKSDFRMGSWRVNFTFHWEPGRYEVGWGQMPLCHR